MPSKTGSKPDVRSGCFNWKKPFIHGEAKSLSESHPTWFCDVASVVSGELTELASLLSAFVVGNLPVASSAYEVLEVCATYVGTGKSYEITVNIFEGSELNERTSSFDYNSFDKYAVIFWEDDWVSVIELESSLCNIGFGCDGVDRQGYKWEIKTGYFSCYWSALYKMTR